MFQLTRPRGARLEVWFSNKNEISFNSRAREGRDRGCRAVRARS